MTMLRIFMVSLGFLFAVALQAEPLAIRSGDHAKFSRLVIPLSSRIGWEVKHHDDTAILKIDNHADGFDTTKVFDWISNARIKAVENHVGTLRLSLGCDCDVAAFNVDGGYLVIDIAEKGQSIAPIIAKTETSAGGIKTDPVRIHSTILAAKAENKNSTKPMLPLILIPKNPSGVDASTQDGPIGLLMRSELEKHLLDDVQKRLARNFGNAATVGVLTPESSQTKNMLGIASRTTAPQEPALPLDQKPSTNPAASTSVFREQMRVTSSMDIPEQPGSVDTLSISAGLICPPAAEIEISDWSSTEDFTHQVSEARQKLFEEFDKVNEPAALKLAKIYLYFGFGIEAKRTLALSESLYENHPNLIELSEIIDHGHVRGSGNLYSLAACESDFALWGILAKTKTDHSSRINTDAALRALNKLPVHLRIPLAVELSKRLLSFGQNEAAATALRSIKRLSDPLPAEGLFASAQLDLAEGRTDAAHHSLETLSRENATPSPAALVALVKSKLEQKQPIPIEAAALVEAYAHELRDTEIGPEMQLTHVIALLRSGQFDKAFKAVEMLTGQSAKIDAEKMRRLFLAELTRSASDIVFLEYIFGQSDENIAQLEPDTILRAALRLQENGFAAAAQRVLSNLPDRPHNSRRQMLEANIALKLDQPQRAIAALLLEQDPAAGRLRVLAKIQANEGVISQKISAALGDDNEDGSADWLTDEWRGFEPPATPLFDPVARISAQPSLQIPASEGMLAKTSAVLEESASARAIIDSLLNDQELDISTEPE